jgi:hypothetical protein
MEYKLVQPLWKSIWSLLRKLKTEVSYDPATPLLSIYPKESMGAFNRDTYMTMFIVALFTTAKILIGLGAYEWMNGSRKCGLYTQGDFIQP